MGRHLSENDKATQSLAEEGLNNSTWMPPLRVKEAINAQVPAYNFSSNDFVISSGNNLTIKKGYSQSFGTTVTFERNQIYGTVDAPESGNIIIDDSTAELGVKVIIIHKDSTEPDYGSGSIVESGSGTYSTTSYNKIEYTYIRKGVITYNVESFSHEDVATGLILYYDFNQEDGDRTIIYDRSKNNNDATITNENDINWIDMGNGRYSIRIGNDQNDSNRAFFNIPTSTSLQSLSTGFTISFWMGSDTLFGDDIFATHDDSVDDDEQGITINGLTSSARIETYLNSEIDGSVNTVRTSTGELYATNGVDRSLIIFKYDGVDLTVKVNDVLSDTLNVSSLNISNNNGWILGKDFSGNVPDNLLLNDFRVYNRALTSAEETAIYNLGE